MKKLITKFNSKGLKVAIAMLVMVAASVGSSFAQAPWCGSGHTYAYQTSASSHYVSINEVQILSAGNMIYRKAPDGWNGTQNVCYSEYKLANTPSKAIDLVAGGKYTLAVNSTSSWNGYQGYLGLYIDYNINNTFDAGEMISNSSWLMPSDINPTSLKTFDFTLPCNLKTGQSRLRLVSEITWYSAPGLAAACNNSCAMNGSYNSPYYGETEDFIVNLLLPTSIVADFVAPSQAFINTAVKFTNKYNTHITNEWDRDLNGYDYTGTNYSTSWSTTGSKCVKLRSTNCLGKDSIIKCVNIVSPTQVPTADFIASATQVEIYGGVQLFDLSTQGPTSWNWEVYDDSDPNNIKDENSGALSISNATDQNPFVDFDELGCYTVVLTSRNSIGLSAPVKKICYIKVVALTQYNLCYNAEKKTQSPTGTVYDDGGPKINYRTSNADRGCAYLTITPCNAEKINLVFTEIKFAKADHYVKVYDNPYRDPKKLLYTVTNADKSKLPLKITATSGSMYIEFDAQSGGVDSGFAAYYTSELGPPSPPSPSFKVATTPGYNRAPLRFTNTTSNIAGVPDYVWTIDDDEVGNADTIQMPDGRIDMMHQFLDDGPYKVCLEVRACTGTKQYCETINIVTPNTKTDLDFVASNDRPAIGEKVTMTTTSDKASNWKWDIFPTTVEAASGSSPALLAAELKKQNPKLIFRAAGKYTFTLRAWNANDSANTVAVKVKDKYVVVLDYCNPIVNILSQDVAISRVILKETATNDLLIDNTSDVGVSGYTNYASTVEIPTLTYGAEYTLQVNRQSVIDPANRTAWIDFNIDGDFDDAGEQILVESSNNDLTKSVNFTVPFLSQAYQGTAKMRIAINYANNSNTPCGPSVAGEYEDYSIKLANDNLPPMLTLKGSDTVRIEKCFPYVDLGATAMDPTEGDISSRIVKTTDLDSCTEGIYTVEYNVKDASGNAAGKVVRTILVVKDKTKPVITVGGANPYIIQARRNNPPYAEPGLVTATDNLDGDVTSSIIVDNGGVDTRKLGVYTITYTVQDVQKNTDTKTRTVIVVDTIKPEIQQNGPVQLQIGSLWVDQTLAVDSFDNNPVLEATPGYNGNVNTLAKGSYPVSYMATDQSGNVFGPVVRTYVVDDYIAPVVTFDGAQGKVYTHDVHKPYVSEKPSKSDNYYPDAAVSLVLTNPNVVNPDVLGTYVEIWKAEDASGNVTLAERTVNVVDREAPVIFADIIHACVGDPINPYEGVSTTDNYYGPAQLKPIIEVINSNVNQWQQGIYTITYRVTDPSNNTSAPFTRMVQYTAWPNCFNSLSVGDVNIADVISLYPNPTNGLVTINVAGNVSDNVNVEVFTTTGVKVQTPVTQAGTSSYTIDLSSFATGIYMVKMNVGGHIVTKQVAKN